MNRREFISSSFAAGAMPMFAMGKKRIARVGLMTDTHIGETMESCSRVRAALKLFKAQGVEMVINCGDIADQHYPEGYRCYRKTVNEVYPDPASRPIERFVYAYHDIAGYRSARGTEAIRLAASAFADVHRFLQAPNTHTDSLEWKGMAFLNFPQMTGNTGFLSWKDYEEAVRRACEAHPGKPVFVLDHLPPYGTTYNSMFWGSRDSRRILNKYPQVVSLSGHVHGSLACERQIWQGEFTAVNIGCLQTWAGYAPGSNPPSQRKNNFGVLVMDVYDDRLVFARLDVRDGSAFGPPWVVPLPFAARSAPFRPSAAAERTTRAAFADGVSLQVVPTANGYRVSIPDSTVGPAAFMYRIEAMRRDAAGNWSVFTRDDVFSEFWKATKDRTGRVEHTLSAAFFSVGGEYRVRVTPLDWFYRGTRPLERDFTATVSAGEVVWKSARPLDEMRFSQYGKPVAATDGRFVPSSGQGTLWLPDNVLSALKPGEHARCVLEVDTVQQEGEWWSWHTEMRARGGRSLGRIVTAPGTPGPLCYSFEFVVPPNGMTSAEFLFNNSIRGGSVRPVSVAVMR